MVPTETADDFEKVSLWNQNVGHHPSRGFEPMERTNRQWSAIVLCCSGSHIPYGYITIASYQKILPTIDSNPRPEPKPSFDCRHWPKLDVSVRKIGSFLLHEVKSWIFNISGRHRGQIASFCVRQKVSISKGDSFKNIEYSCFWWVLTEKLSLCKWK